MKHPENVPGWAGTLEELAYAIENLRYDKFGDFLLHLGAAVAARGLEDSAAKREQLGNTLAQMVIKIEGAFTYAAKAWKISEQYMKKDV